MINNVVKFFEDKSNSTFSSKVDIIDSLGSMEKISNGIPSDVREGNVSYSKAIFMLYNFLDEIELTKDFLLRIYQVQSHNAVYQELLKEVLSSLISIKQNIRRIESDYLEGGFNKKRQNQNDNGKLQPIRWKEDIYKFEALYEMLIKEEIIEETDMISTYAHFLISLSTDEFDLIKWKRSKSLLAYFIKQLKENKLIDKFHYWNISSPHFIIKGENTSNLKGNLNSNPYPVGHDIIDGIIKKIS